MIIQRRAFTLIELLITIGIIAVLATATALILNPAELTRKARDSARVSDLDVLHKALDLFETAGYSATGNPARVYISLPDTAADNCNTSTGGTAYSLPQLPSGNTYWCVAGTSLEKIDGSGWVPVDFSSIPEGAPFSILPKDPINTGAGNLYYTYVAGGSWQLTALMEAKKHDAAVVDGGRMPGIYEKGSNLSLGPFTRDQGLAGRWTFDEGSGSTVYDSSGNGKNGTLTSGPAWASSGSCKAGSCLLFDGVASYVQVNNFWDSLGNNYKGPITYTMWFKANSGTIGGIIDDSNSGEGYIRVNLTANTVLYSFNGSRTMTLTNSTDWHFAALTSDSTINSFTSYLDTASSSQVAGPCTDWCGPDGYLRIGGGPNAGVGFFNGYIDEVRVYKRILSADEINAVYQSGF